MKYSLLLSLLSLIAWKYDCLFPAGLLGLLAGFLFSLLFRRKIQILAIGYISAGILTVILFPIEFSFAAIARNRYRLGGGHHSTYDVSYSL